MSQDASDVSYRNGWKIPTKMVLEVDAFFTQALTSEQILKIWKIKL